MNKKTLWQILLAGIVVVIIVLGVSARINQNNATQRTATSVSTPTDSQTETAVVTIEGLYTNKVVSLESNVTVLQLLEVLHEEDAHVQLVTKEYSGLGVLVEGMAGMTNGDDNQYWQYRVNGLMPQVGADVLEVEEGDKIEWFFEKSTF